MIVKTILKRIGDDAMKPDQMQMRFSSVGITLFVVSLAAGVRRIGRTEPRRPRSPAPWSASTSCSPFA